MTKKEIKAEITRLYNLEPRSHDHFKEVVAAIYVLEWVIGSVNKRPSKNYKRD